VSVGGKRASHRVDEPVCLHAPGLELFEALLLGVDLVELYALVRDEDNLVDVCPAESKKMRRGLALRSVKGEVSSQGGDSRGTHAAFSPCSFGNTRTGLRCRGSRIAAQRGGGV
jgi:hypothetical protein